MKWYMDRSSLIDSLPEWTTMLHKYRLGVFGEYSFADWLTQTSLDCRSVESSSMWIASSGCTPFSLQVTFFLSLHPLMPLVWSTIWVLEAKPLRQRAMLLETWQNSTPFHQMWKTCGLAVSMHLRSQRRHSTDFSLWSRWWLATAYSGMLQVWNWTISLLFSPLILEWRVSFGHRPCRWLVGSIGWFEYADLPQLQSVRLSDNAFTYCHSVVFESRWNCEWIR